MWAPLLLHEIWKNMSFSYIYQDRYFSAWKYGILCISSIWVKMFSQAKCNLYISGGKKANGDISGRSMVISALPKNFSFWNRWFFFFFSVRLERVCLYMSVLVRPVFVCVSVWEDGGLLQTINKEMNARGNETCSKQRRNQEVCREGEV